MARDKKFQKKLIKNPDVATDDENSYLSSELPQAKQINKRRINN